MSGQKFVLDPFQNEAIGRRNHDVLTFKTRVKRLNPGLILLRWKGFFEMTKAMVPEAIHRRRVSIVVQDAAVEACQTERRILPARLQVIHRLDQASPKLTSMSENPCNTAPFPPDIGAQQL
jgi:hypothetical protein